jgi:uncharacterized protein (DUF2141 family)
VSCHGDSNGQITVTAEGGVERYTATLFRANSSIPLQEIDFSKNENAVFSGLTAGEYTIKVVDDNDGTSLNNDEIIPITQPSAPVTVELQELLTE